MQSSVARAQNMCKAIEMLSVLGEKKSILIQVLRVTEYISIFPLTCSSKAVQLHKSSY